MLARRTSEANTVVCGSSPNGNSRKWTDLFTVTFTKHSSHVRESKTVLDSGFHVTHSGFRVLNSSLFSVKSLSFIPDFRFHNHKFSWFRNLDSLTWGWKPVFLNSQTNAVFAASSSYGHLFRFPRVPAYESICCGSISSLIQILFPLIVSNSLSYITIPKNIGK